MISQYEIVVPYREEYREESNEPDLKTPEDCHRHAMFVKGNEHLINGRTYCSKDEDGNYISCFVSQYSDIIERNLEPGIRKAVLGLHEKGYLTFTSCQGHDDSRHRYIGVLFNTKEQKHNFISEVDELDCNVYWYDNVLNSVERPCTESEWWDDGGMTVHIVYDDRNMQGAPQQTCREKPYTDDELTKFWNIQSNRNYEHYECIVFSFGYPMVEKSFWKAMQKYFFYDHSKVKEAYSDFLTKVSKLSDYLA